MRSRAIVSLFAFVASLLAAGAAFAAPPETPWELLSRARISLEAGEYGEALRLANAARDARRAERELSLDILHAALRPAEVKRAGDDIPAVLAVLDRREDAPAASIIRSALDGPAAPSFGKSVSKVIAWLERTREYPEADVLSGAVYEAEGEYAQAMTYYERAWESRDILDIPEDRIPLVYRMADVSAMMDDQGAREKYLLLVLSEDPVFGTPGSESPTLLAMIRSAEEEETLEKFFKLYRHSRYFTLKAYQDLAIFYYQKSRSRLDRALPVSAMASCVVVTRLSEAVRQYDFEYVYAGLSDLMSRVGKRREIAEWAASNRAWETLVTFGSILWDRGARSQAAWLWAELAAACPDKRWAAKARRELDRAGKAE